MSHFKLVIGREAVDTDTRMPVINPATEDVVAFVPWPASNISKPPSLQPNAPSRHGRVHRSTLVARSYDRSRTASKLASSHWQRCSHRNKASRWRKHGWRYSEACAILRHFAQAELPIRTFRDSEVERIYERRAPLGIVAAIVPWNFPIVLLMNKLAPALLTGNCIIAKPAPTTPLTTLEIGHLCAGILPAGVISVLSDANNLGASLTSHPDIAKVSFTGSTETGRKVFQSGAATLKRLTLELGGNDPALILDDADLDTVAPQIFRCAMANSGQVCMAIKRVYVPDALYDGLSDRLAALAAAPSSATAPIRDTIRSRAERARSSND